MKRCHLLRVSTCRTGSVVRWLWVMMMTLLPSSLSAQTELTKLLMDILNGPKEYYAPDAYAYFTKKGVSIPPQKSLEEAVTSFRATLKIAAMGRSAGEALQVLIDVFPRGIQVTEVRNVRYNGEGTFEDWISTYVTSEKTKFLLSSPFLSYNEMSRCEQFVISTYEVARLNGEPVTIATNDPVVISVIHTVYFGAYAITAITGQHFGVEKDQWQQWWTSGGKPPEGGGVATVATGDVGKARLRSGQLFSDIVPRGKYHMYLSTGDDLIGYVESKSDDELILETGEGKAYSFKSSIIIRYEYLEPPKPTSVAPEKTGAKDSLPFSFDELRGRSVGNRQIEVRINSGMVFRGTLKEINEQAMKLRVGTSVIPITRDVVVNVKLVSLPTATAPVKKPASTAASGRDTVVVKNNTTDEWGAPLPDFVYVGTITADNQQGVVITTSDSGEKKVPRALVLRVVKNSADDYDTDIKRYAEPIFCSDDMFLVDLPPGKQGRPFFKVCVDRYEFPNVKGARPKTGASYDDARILCSKRGKRLCTADEWQWACGGLEGYTYPYGWNPEKEKCNTDDGRPEESGSRVNCVGKFGGYDMVGNVFEWVTGPNKQPALMGGPNSKCQTITEGVGGGAKPNSGFRCCRSN
jgi:hypothetical protein